MLNLSRGLKKHQTIQAMRRTFSTEQEASPVPEPTDAEKEAARTEWGIKYDDECLKFEKEWEIIAKKVQEEQSVYIQSELGELQMAKV